MDEITTAVIIKSAGNNSVAPSSYLYIFQFNEENKTEKGK